MTQSEYYKILKEEHKKVNWKDKRSIEKYNDFVKNLRSLMEFEQE